MKFKKFVYPFIPAVLVLALVLYEKFGSFSDQISAGIILFGVLLILLLVIFPCCCFLYGKRLLLPGENKLIFVLYNSFIITLGYLLPLCTEPETYIYSAVLFAWCVFWTSLPLIIAKHKNTRQPR